MNVYTKKIQVTRGIFNGILRGSVPKGKELVGETVNATYVWHIMGRLGVIPWKYNSSPAF